jgi:hypothetical protein
VTRLTFGCRDRRQSGKRTLRSEGERTVEGLWKFIGQATDAFGPEEGRELLPSLRIRAKHHEEPKSARTTCHSRRSIFSHQPAGIWVRDVCSTTISLSPTTSIPCLPHRNHLLSHHRLRRNESEPSSRGTRDEIEKMAGERWSVSSFVRCCTASSKPSAGRESQKSADRSTSTRGFARPAHVVGASLPHIWLPPSGLRIAQEGSARPLPLRFSSVRLRFLGGMLEGRLLLLYPRRETPMGRGERHRTSEPRPAAGRVSERLDQRPEKRSWCEAHGEAGEADPSSPDCCQEAGDDWQAAATRGDSKVRWVTGFLAKSVAAISNSSSTRPRLSPSSSPSAAKTDQRFSVAEARNTSVKSEVLCQM